MCSIADCISNDLDYDLTESLDTTKILDILHTVGCETYKEADFHDKTMRQHDKMMRSMKKIILDYVQETCGCVL